MTRSDPVAEQAAYEEAVRRTVASLPPWTQEIRDEMSLLLRGARVVSQPETERRAS